MRSAAGRVLGFALILVLLMSAVGLAASQTFINKTGKTVSGIKIEFSKQVLIIRHDSAFPDQNPSGRSDEFTFSGKDLRNFGRFSITWMPSFGKVVNYEWIEKTQPSQPSQVASTNGKQEFVLPDPNTPPILYGDDYPGPDEPKYQPQPDEQIWLTDLDGHGDIYDNDSIKINYAPGFDVSQITKIDVYRNGIRLRFVPEKFDVLTNAQMKTFDGNPAEHSPASNHTDHAIMGYEYKFKISTADDLWILKKTVKSGFRWHPKEVWAFLAISWYWHRIDDFPFETIVQFLTDLKHDGFSGVTFDIPFYVMTPCDSKILALYDIRPGVVNWDIVTPTTSELDKILRAATEARVDIHVRGHLYISQKYQDEHGFTYSSSIEPSNPKDFFDNYTELLLELAPLLNKHNVTLLTPFIEMDGIEKYSDRIKRMCSKLSEVFTGELGFDENTHNMIAGYSPIYHHPINSLNDFEKLVRNFTFWDWTDSQGRPMNIEYNSWTSRAIEDQVDQRVSVIERKSLEFWSIPTSYYTSTYPNNPVIWGEIGARDIDGYVLGPDYFYSIPKSKREPDEQERADAMCAMLQASKELGIAGLNINQFILGDVYPNWEEGTAMNIGYALPESPEYRVITSIIKPDE